jgi:hypothetical protein
MFATIDERAARCIHPRAAFIGDITTHQHIEDNNEAFATAKCRSAAVQTGSAISPHGLAAFEERKS